MYLQQSELAVSWCRVDGTSLQLVFITDRWLIDETISHVVIRLVASKLRLNFVIRSSLVEIERFPAFYAMVHQRVTIDQFTNNTNVSNSPLSFSHHWYLSSHNTQHVQLNYTNAHLLQINAIIIIYRKLWFVNVLLNSPNTVMYE